jgi:hypothetical protein
MADRPHGFVPLKSITRGAPDPAAALAEIRSIYFKTSRKTIDHDFAHAIELLKALPDEDTRAKAHVYMEGLAEMRREWGGGKTGKVRSRKSEGRSK